MNKRTAWLVVCNAFVWAAMMIATSLMRGNMRAASDVWLVFACGWMASSLLLSAERRGAQGPGGARCRRPAKEARP